MNGVYLLFDGKVWLDTRALFIVDVATLVLSCVFDSSLRAIFLLASGQWRSDLIQALAKKNESHSETWE